MARAIHIAPVQTTSLDAKARERENLEADYQRWLDAGGVVQTLARGDKSDDKPARNAKGRRKVDLTFVSKKAPA
jgi:hypothetical protein